MPSALPSRMVRDRHKVYRDEWNGGHTPQQSAQDADVKRVQKRKRQKAARKVGRLR